MLSEGESTNFSSSEPHEWISKRPKLLEHEFKLKRQKILLLNIRGASTSKVLSAQERKIIELSQFIENADRIIRIETSSKIRSVTLDGIEMLLRAVTSIQSPSKQSLLFKLCNLKLLIISQSNPPSSYLESCFNDCLRLHDTESVDVFQEYMGIDGELDRIISAKILKFVCELSLKERIKLCFEFQKDYHKASIMNEVLKSVFNLLKVDSSINLDSETLLALLDLISTPSSFDLNLFAEHSMILLQASKVQFLSDPNIFGKFLEPLKSSQVQNSPLTASIITTFNSRIRSALGRPELKTEFVYFNCLKFVLQFIDLKIGCIHQFADHLLKSPFVKFEDLKLHTRKLYYNLLKNLIKLNNLSFSNFPSLFESIKQCSNEDLKYEFGDEMIESESKGRNLLLSLFSDYSNQNFIQILEKYLKSNRISIFEDGMDTDDLFIIENFDAPVPEDYDQKLEIEEDVLTFFATDLLQFYMKSFKNYQNYGDESMIRVFSAISGLLLGKGKISWAELSGNLGPNFVASQSRWESRLMHCKLYKYWLKMDEIQGNIKNTLRSVLNPLNSVELWLKCLLDFKDYGQVDFFNEYFGLFLNTRIECLKVLNAPAKYTFELILKSIDFKSEISSDFWNYLFDIGFHLIGSNSSLKGPICALFSRNLMTSNVETIFKFYSLTISGMNVIEHKDLIASRSQLLSSYVNVNSDNVCKFLCALRDKIHSKGLLLKIFDELVNSEKCDVVAQLAIVSINVFSRVEIELITLGLRSKSLNYCKNSQWPELYDAYVIMNQLNIIPKDLRFELNFLCDLCKLDRLDLKYFGSNDSNDRVEESFRFENIEEGILVEMENINVMIVKRQFINSFHCLCELMKLLWSNLIDFRVEIENYVSYLHKSRGASDEYFHILFPK